MKASGAYAALIQGVSQQVPQDRRDGQLTEMVNMLPDPVNGLSRRHGSRWVAERDTGLSPAAFAALTADTDSWRTFEYNNAGHDYVVMFRTTTRPVGSTMPAMLVFDRTAVAFLPVVRPVTDAVLDLFESGGCSAVTAIGKYLFAAGHSIVPAATTTEVWEDAANQDKAVVWVRGGGYSRTFSVNAVKVDDSTVSFTYTTPKSSFAGILDTSKVPPFVAKVGGTTEVKTEGAFVQLIGGVYEHTLTWGEWTPTGLSMKKGSTAMTNVSPAAPANDMEFAWAAAAKKVTFHSSSLGVTNMSISYTVVETETNPNYAQIVTAMTNEYNSAVTKHIGDAAEAIQPQAIAEQLKLAAINAGLVGATRQDSTVILEGVKALTVQDGGDGSLIRGVANEVSSADQISNLHLIGKVVKVRAKGSEEAYYLKAESKDPTLTSGYAEVTWVEGAGTVYEVTEGLVYGVAVSGTFYLASSATKLNGITAGDHPAYIPSTVGDSSTSPLPFFVGRKVTYLGVFQDRLLIGSGGVIRASKVGDYLNFFRTSVLTAPANDALEMLSQGSEDDELRHSVLYDRDLVLFGVKRQYAVSGRVPLAPASANMPVMSSHEGAAQIPPVAAGGLIFYTKRGEESPSAHEIRPGQVAESPESFPVSSQLNTYFMGNAIELITIAKPSMLFMRTSGNRSSVYQMTYLDTPQGRRQDAWGRWDFAPELGVIVGMTSTPAGLMVYSLRVAHDKVWAVADVCPLNTGVSFYPYFDSLRSVATVDAGTGSLRADTPGEWFAAFTAATEYKFLGSELAEKADLASEFPAATGMVVGAKQISYFIPTNPFVRDSKDKPITVGRLTITKLVVTFAKSSGFGTIIDKRGVSSLSAVTGDAVTTSFNGHIVGSADSVMGRVPITSGQATVPVGKETREYTAIFQARTWLPLTITSFEWVGQFFNHTQRL